MNDILGVQAQSLQASHIHLGFIFLLEAIVYVLVVGSKFNISALQITAYTTGDSFSSKCFKKPHPLSPIFGVSRTNDRLQFDDSLKQKFCCLLDPCAWYASVLLSRFIY